MRQSKLSLYALVISLTFVGCDPNPKNDKKPSPAAYTPPQNSSANQDPKKDRQPDQPQPSLSFVETKVATCEDKIRPLVKDNNMPFKTVMEFKTAIEELKAAQSGQAVPAELEVREKKSQYLEYKKTSSFRNGASHYTLIGLNDKGHTNPLYFEIGSSQLTKTAQITLSQRYTLETTTKDCELKLSQTTLDIVERSEGDKYKFKTKAIAYDGSVIEDKSAEVTLMPDEVLNTFAEFEKTEKDVAAKTGRKIMVFNYYTPKPVEIKLEADGTMEDVVFGQKLEFKKFKMVFKKVNKEKTLHLRRSEKAGIAMHIALDGTITWNLPEDQYFERIHLGQPQSSALESSKLTLDYQKNSKKLQLRTKMKMLHENFSAYFKVLKMDERNNEIIYELEENDAPVTAGKVVPEDLASNSTIQVHLPEIKKIADEIKAKAGTDRSVQIHDILSYLKTNYKYDKEMFRRNVIRPLTTKEALDRKQGVCQHYAVLFVSIARALGIPSRIIGGYNIIGPDLYKHAWVEAEIESGKWQVIEPQSQNGLTETYTRFYFPWFRFMILENKEAKFTEDEEEFLSENIFEFSPVK